jgi:hypothetical protein
MSNIEDTVFYKAFLEETPKVIYITETKKDADFFHSLDHSVITGDIAKVEAFINQNLSVIYMLALSSEESLRKYADLLKTKNVKFYALLPEQGATWAETLKTENMNSAMFRGKIALVVSPQEVAKIYFQNKQEDVHNTVFIFLQVTYIIKVKNNVCSAQPLINGVVVPKYFHNTGREGRYFIVEISTKTYKVLCSELNSQKLFMQWLREHQISFQKTHRHLKDFAALAEFIQSQSNIELRKPKKIGYDTQTKCYIFPGFLYDENGTKHQIEEHGLFSTFAVVAPDIPTGCPIVQGVNEKAILEQIIKDFYQCYGNAGILLLGGYIASIFADDFPIIETKGNPAHVYLNRMFFMDFDGVPLPQKGSLNQVVKTAGCFSQWLIPFEEDHHPVKLNEASLLSAKTNQATLLFHRTFGEFATQEMLACSVSIKCTQYKPMHDYQPSQLAAVGHAVMTNRNYFEDAIADKTQQLQIRLKTEGVSGDVVYNHAVLLAGAELLIEQLGLDFINNDELYDYTLQLAQRRSELLTNRHPLADAFFEMLFSKVDVPDFNQTEKCEAEQAAYATGTAILGGQLVVTMPKVLGDGAKPPQLFNQLQLHPGYITHNHHLRIARPSGTKRKLQIRYWVFDFEQVRLA